MWGGDGTPGGLSLIHISQNLAKLAKEADAGRVVIEYNGMWLLQDLANNLPENWIEMCIRDRV